MKKCVSYVLSFIMIFMSVTYVVGGQKEVENQYGFQKRSESYEKGIESNVIIYEHKESGAQVVYVQNKDPNKVFAIGFKTPIHDNTGVNHIIEHTVFTGSRKYNTKDVFFEMNKRSPNIYMNASTGADMTIYPFSTRNHKDYENLMDVYLDAVFFPNLQQYRYGFDQEGWHYSIDEENQIHMNGVVYNEMKGASVIPQRILAMTNRAVMYPDTMYIYNAGGNPDSIPDLSYENCKKTHENYYVPSNSCTFVYGDVNIEDTLEKLNEYYSQFDKDKVQNISQKQEKFPEMKYYTGYYPAVNKSQDCFVSINYAVGNIEDTKLQISMEILMNLLVQYENSPLKSALNKRQLSKMLYVDVDSAIPQPMYSIITTDVNKTDVEEVNSLIQETLQKTAREGFSDELIKITINGYELDEKQKKSNISKGREMAYDVLHSWGHDVPVRNILRKLDIINQIKKEGSSEYFQKLLKENILNNNHVSRVVLQPDDNYIVWQQEQEKQRIEAVKSSITHKEINRIIKDKEELERWQQGKNDAQILPKLDLEEIDTSFELPQLIVKEGKKDKKLFYKANTNDLVYMNLYFDTSYIPEESLNELFLLAHLIAGQEKDDISLYTGGIGCEVMGIPHFDNFNRYDPKLNISLCMTKDNITKAFQILERATYGMNVWDSQWLLTQIHKIGAQYENYLNSKPLNIMSVAVNNSQTGASRYEYETLIPFYQYICQVEEDYDKYKDQIMEKLSFIQKSVFNKNNLILGATLEEENIRKLESSYKKYYKNLYDVKYSKVLYSFDNKYKRQGFPIASDVQYIVWGGNYKQVGGVYSGTLYVLANILNADYMLQNLRVQNGAYGAGVAFSPYGSVNIYTSQDPQLQNSLKIIRDIPRYIAHFDVPVDIMTNYKIGALSKFEQSLGLNEHPKVIGEILQVYHLSGFNHEQLNQTREQILLTQCSDIRELSPIMKKVIEEKRYSIAGSKARLLNSKEYFDIIQSFSTIYNN